MGGVQTMQEKMNLADVNKSQVDSSSEEEEQVPNQQDGNKLQVPSRPASATNASQHSGEELLQNNRDSHLSLPSIYEGRNSSTPMTIENVEELGSQRSKHGLPEDQEIIDEEEEEEEEDV